MAAVDPATAPDPGWSGMMPIFPNSLRRGNTTWTRPGRRQAGGRQPGLGRTCAAWTPLCRSSHQLSTITIWIA